MNQTQKNGVSFIINHKQNMIILCIENTVKLLGIERLNLLFHA